MALRIRRGTNSQRIATIFDQGELVWTTDQNQLFVGDGGQGGVSIAESIAGDGLLFDSATGTLKTAALTLSTDDVTEGNRWYFTEQRAQDATAHLFANGTQSGITFQYNDVDNAMNVTVDAESLQDVIAPLFTSGSNTGISFTYADSSNRIDAVVSQEYIQDRAASLFETGTQTGITFEYDDAGNKINATVESEYIQDKAALLFTAGTHTGITFDYIDGSDKINATVSIDAESVQDLIAPLFTNGNSGNTDIIFSYHDNSNTITAAVATVVQHDLAPTLGGNLNVNNYTINGTGDINVTGSISNNTISISTDTIDSTSGSVVVNTTNGLEVTNGLITSSITAAPSNTLTLTGNQYSFITTLSTSSDGSVLTTFDNLNKVELSATGTIAVAESIGAFTGKFIDGSTSNEFWSGMTIQIDPSTASSSTDVKGKLVFSVSNGSLNSDPKLLTFNSLGRLAVNQEFAVSTLDVNGDVHLSTQTTAPSSGTGKIAVASGNPTEWDPAKFKTDTNYLTFYNGSNWGSVVTITNNEIFGVPAYSNGSGFTVNVTVTSGSYSAVVTNNAGSSYVKYQEITVPGASLGGTVDNDITIFVKTVNGSGAITDFEFSGTSISGNHSYTAVSTALAQTTTSLDLFNRNDVLAATNNGPKTVNAFLNASTISIGASTGTTTINNSVSINGVLKLSVLSSAPTGAAGEIAVANGLTSGWDPKGTNLGVSYPCYHNGTSWVAMI